MTPHQRATRALSAMMHQDAGEHDGPHNAERCLACQLHRAVVREIEEAEAEAQREVLRLQQQVEEMQPHG